MRQDNRVSNNKQMKTLKEWKVPTIVNLELTKTKSGRIQKHNENTKNDHSGL